MKLLWRDTEEIALRLLETKPSIDPLTVRFTDLRDWVTALEEFDDDPDDVSEAKLEAIQMAWHAEFGEL
jgi:FeS assembly protein IscX